MDRKSSELGENVKREGFVSRDHVEMVHFVCYMFSMKIMLRQYVTWAETRP